MTQQNRCKKAGRLKLQKDEAKGREDECNRDITTVDSARNLHWSGSGKFSATLTRTKQRSDLDEVNARPQA